jgi:hypothetical protein
MHSKAPACTQPTGACRTAQPGAAVTRPRVCLLPDRPPAVHSSPRLARPGARPAPARRRVRRAPQQRAPVRERRAGERRPPRVRPEPRRRPRGCAAQRAHQAPRQQLLRVPRRRARGRAGGAWSRVRDPSLGPAGRACRSARAELPQPPLLGRPRLRAFTKDARNSADDRRRPGEGDGASAAFPASDTVVPPHDGPPSRALLAATVPPHAHR